MTADEHIKAVRFLDQQGQVSALAVADHVGWVPRTAGPRMRSLEKKGIVKRVCVKPSTARSDARYEWVLTKHGRNTVQA